MTTLQLLSEAILRLEITINILVDNHNPLWWQHYPTFPSKLVWRQFSEIPGCTNRIKKSSFGSLYFLNTLRPRQNGRHFPDDIFKWIFFNENVWISMNISLKFIPRGPINNIPSLVQIMAWRLPGDKPLSEPMIFNLPTHICVTRLHWVRGILLQHTFHCNTISHTTNR